MDIQISDIFYYLKQGGFMNVKLLNALNLNNFFETLIFVPLLVFEPCVWRFFGGRGGWDYLKDREFFTEGLIFVSLTPPCVVVWLDLVF